MATYTITEAEVTSPLTVSPGDEIVVRLPENPSTGFRWHVETVPPGMLDAENDEFAVSAMAPGAAGTRVLSFRARSPGSAQIGLKLFRAWEGDSSALSSYAVGVTVRAQ